MADIVITAGIDVSKDRLDVALWPEAGARGSFALGEIAPLIAWLGAHRVSRIGVEASGGYEREVVRRLSAAGFVVVVANPLRVRRFAQAKGRLAKNDRADAATIAEFTATLAALRPLREAALDRLGEYLMVRRQLQLAVTDTVNQLEHLHEAELRRLVTAQRWAQATHRAARSAHRRAGRRATALAGAGQAIAQRARGGTGAGSYPDRAAARARAPDPPPSRQPGRGGAVR
jgi:transposase